MRQEKSNSVCMFVWNNFVNDARVFRECSSLVESGFKVTLICLKNEGDGTKLLEDIAGIRVKRVRKRVPIITDFKIAIISKHLGNAMVMLKMILEGYRVKAEYYHSNDLNTLPQGAVCSKFRLRKRALIYDSHEVQTSRSGYSVKLVKPLEKTLLRFVDKMIMTTNTRAEYTSKLYNREKPDVIHNYPSAYKLEETKAVDFHELLNISSEMKVLLYQGGIQEGRGLENLVEAMQYVDKGILVLIGGGKLRKKIEALITQLKLEKKIRLINTVEREQLKKYTCGAYVGFQVLQNTCFNHYSALSNKLFEYVMAEVPVIVSDLPEMRRIVEETKCGLVTDTTKSENIAEAINYLIDNEDVRNEMKHNCKGTKQRYCWEEEEKKLLDVYYTI